MTPDRTIYSAPCPICHEPRKAWADYKQATRREPMTFLGFSGYCAPCMLGYVVENPQMPLVAV